jgi:hypothetical protein
LRDKSAELFLRHDHRICTKCGQFRGYFRLAQGDLRFAIELIDNLLRCPCR